MLYWISCSLQILFILTFYLIFSVIKQTNSMKLGGHKLVGWIPIQFCVWMSKLPVYQITQMKKEKPFI